MHYSKTNKVCATCAYSDRKPKSGEFRKLFGADHQ